MDKTRLQELAGLETLLEAEYVVAQDKNAIDALLKMRSTLNGKTALYILRDSDLNGIMVSTKPITTEMQSDAIKKHSAWK
jgi:hypothetical protein